VLEITDTCHVLHPAMFCTLQDQVHHLTVLGIAAACVGGNIDWELQSRTYNSMFEPNGCKARPGFCQGCVWREHLCIWAAPDNTTRDCDAARQGSAVHCAVCVVFPGSFKWS